MCMLTSYLAGRALGPCHSLLELSLLLDMVTIHTLALMLTTCSYERVS